MSGSGKTWWSKKLASHGFTHYCCDDIIERKLEKELKPLGYSGIKDLSRWMGQPYDLRYKRRSKRYLELEYEAVKEIITKIKSNIDENIVIDTTGSFIYLGKSIQKELKSLTTVIYIDTPESIRKQMFELYKKDPKPVIWGTMYKKQSTESNSDALERCYPQLLNYRTQEYAKLCGIVIDHHLINQSMTLKNLTQLVKEHV